MVDNVNVFGAVGGFDMIAARIALQERPIALGHLGVLLEPLVAVYNLVCHARGWTENDKALLFSRFASV